PNRRAAGYGNLSPTYEEERTAQPVMEEKNDVRQIYPASRYLSDRAALRRAADFRRRPRTLQYRADPACGRRHGQQLAHAADDALGTDTLLGQRPGHRQQTHQRARRDPPRKARLQVRPDAAALPDTERWVLRMAGGRQRQAADVHSSQR